MIRSNDIRVRIDEAFASLTADAAFASALYREAEVAELDAGSLVCDQGLSCRHLPLLLTGTARVYNLSRQGREITLYRMQPGDSCVLTAACILSGRPFPAVAVTDSSVSAVLVPATRVIDWSGEFAGWRSFVFGLVAQRLGEVIALVDEIAFEQLDRRLIRFLSQRADAEGEIDITHQQLADELGSSREVITRILNTLQRNQVLSMSRGRIRLLR